MLQSPHFATKRARAFLTCSLAPDDFKSKKCARRHPRATALPLSLEVRAKQASTDALPGPYPGFL